MSSERPNRSFKTHRLLVGLNVCLAVVLALLALIMANALVVQASRTDRWTVDCTRERIFTLSEKTHNILDGLGEDLVVTVLMGDGTVAFQGQGSIDIREKVNDLVTLYGRASERVSARVVDFYRDNLAAARVAKRIGESVEPNTVVLESGSQHRKLALFEMVDIAPDTNLPVFAGEEKLTSAILHLTEPEAAKVYFTVGHGEMELLGPDTPMKRFRGQIQADNYAIATVDLLQAEAVPDDCDALVIAGPETAFQEEEVGLLIDYLEAGGGVFLFVHPAAGGGSIAGLERLLGRYEVRVDHNQIVVPVRQDPAGRSSVDQQLRVVVNDFAVHPITSGLTNMNCMLQWACPVGPLIEEDQTRSLIASRLVQRYEVTALLTSSPDCWGETSIPEVRFDPGVDQKGPISLMVAVSKAKHSSAAGPGPRLAVLGTLTGCIDAPKDGAGFNYSAGNRALIMNTIAWLTAKESRLGIPPQRASERRLDGDPAVWRGVFYIAVLGMPLAAMLFGVGVWFLRRRS